MLITSLARKSMPRAAAPAQKSVEDSPVDGFGTNSGASGVTSGKSIRELVAAGADRSRILKALDNTLSKAKLAPLTQVHGEPHVDRQTVERKVELIEKHGLQPDYHHFTLDDEAFPAEARKAEAEYTQILAESTDSVEKAKIQKRLERLQAARDA